MLCQLLKLLVSTGCKDNKVVTPDPQHDRISVLLGGKDGPPSRKHPRRKAAAAAAVGGSKKTGSRIQGYSGSACRIGTSTEAIRFSAAAASLLTAGGIGTDFLFRGRCLDRADPLSSEQHQPELVLRRSRGHPGIIKKVFAIGKVRTGQVAITK